MSSKLDRREFLKRSAAAAALASGAACLPDVDGSWPAEGSLALCSGSDPIVTPLPSALAGRVVELEDEALLAGLRVNAKAAGDGIKRVMLALTGQSDLKAAWQAVIPNWQDGQVIGIKVNVLNDRVPTHAELVKPVVEQLHEAFGAPLEQIVVWDRRLDELEDARLTADKLGGCVIEGTRETPKDVGNGRGYELGSICLGGQKSHLSNILTRRIDHLINFSVMKNHKASGFTGCLKNNYGVISNPGDFHDEKRGEVVIEPWFNRAIVGINALDEVAAKTRLCLMDAVIGVCKGDTSDPSDCYPKRLLASFDPVAIDARGREIRDEMRGPKLGPSPETISQGWLDGAERAGLGSATVKLEKVR